jgi:hypothetical protein
MRPTACPLARVCTAWLTQNIRNAEYDLPAAGVDRLETRTP